MKKIISEIKTISKFFQEKSTEELTLEIEKIKKRTIKEPLENLLTEWFALVQEISFREIGLRHFDTQLLAGIFLHQGKIVEMKTGEGKTLASTLSVSLNALTKKGVHVVTVNEYLAERDQKWMGKIYKGLGLTSGLVKNTNSIEEKKKSYLADITYLTNSELVFDFLRDSSAFSRKEMVQRPFSYCVIDEIDSILIDEARTQLILSSSEGKKNLTKFYLAYAIANLLEKEKDFQIEEKKKDVNLTDEGYKKTTQLLGIKNLYDPEDPWMLEILNALKAKYLFKLNKDYIVLNQKVLIIDEFTGRIMEDRRWSLGIHEAIEIKEKVNLGGGTKTKSTITYQNFFPLYPKLAGMTGTGKTTEKEFQEIYNLEVKVIPTAKPMARKDLPDLVYQTELAKWKAVLNTAKTCFEKGQPLLIGTANLEKSEFLSDLFKFSKLPHQVLNAKPENVARESEIIAQAGKLKTITIATNMAGRGTDILLGGNPLFSVKQQMEEILFEQEERKQVFSSEIQTLKEKIKEEYNDVFLLKKLIENLPYSLENSLPSFKSLYDFLTAQTLPKWQKENQLVKDLGGLFVLGTERYETRRIDDQLRGRSGRQGDPGISQFFVSLEDDLIKIFGGDSLKKWVEYLIEDPDLPLESNLLTKTLENAQKKVEFSNSDLRKNIFEYDEVLNIQRKQFFEGRKNLFNEIMFSEIVLRTGESFLEEELEKKEDFYSLFETAFDSYSVHKKKRKNEKENFSKEIWISLDQKISETNVYQKEFFKKNSFPRILSGIDFCWTQHLERMNSIRDTINWRAYGQQNPLIEYNLEGFESFSLMFQKIVSSVLYYSIKNPIQ